MIRLYYSDAHLAQSVLTKLRETSSGIALLAVHIRGSSHTFLVPRVLSASNYGP